MIIRGLYIIALLLLTFSCKERFTPKPEGYLRINLDEKIYKKFQTQNCHFSFYLPDYFSFYLKSNCWVDLEYTKHNATIHITYKNLTNNVVQVLEESRNIVYKHTVKADAINEKVYLNDSHQTYGTLYDIKGEAASSVQFHLTDSVSHFIRGALYFKVSPNIDSLRPIMNYLRDDIIHIMETLKWEE